MIFFSAVQPTGQLSIHSYGGPSLETCFDAINQLVDLGWQFTKLDLVDVDRSKIRLPVEAFTGGPLRAELIQLEKTWRVCLSHPEYFAQASAKNRFIKNCIQESIQKQQQISQVRVATTQRLAALYARMDHIQAQIQQTKAEWNIV